MIELHEAMSYVLESYVTLQPNMTNWQCEPLDIVHDGNGPQGKMMLKPLPHRLMQRFSLCCDVQPVLWYIVSLVSLIVYYPERVVSCDIF